MPTTPNYAWPTPASTDYVKDGATAIQNLGNAADATVATMVPKSTVTTKGDLIVATGSAAVTRVGVGANDTYLIADSTQASGVKWGTLPGGGMTQIASGTLSGASVTLGSIAGTYKSLRLVIRNYLPSVDASPLYFRFNGDSAARYGAGAATNSTSAAGNALPFSSTEFLISSQNDNAVGSGLMVVDIPDYANALTWKYLTTTAITVDPTTTTSWRFWYGFGVYNQTAAITSIFLSPLSGTFGGTYILYGVS